MSSQKAIQTESAPKAIGPYSQGIEADCGTMIFVSGQIPIDPKTGQLVGTGSIVDIGQQTERCLDSIEAILEAAGSGFRDVVKTTIYLVDLTHFERVNQVYARKFEGLPVPPPARATVQVAGLPKGASVEIEAIAMKR